MTRGKYWFFTLLRGILATIECLSYQEAMGNDQNSPGTMSQGWNYACMELDFLAQNSILTQCPHQKFSTAGHLRSLIWLWISLIDKEVPIVQGALDWIWRRVLGILTVT